MCPSAESSNLELYLVIFVFGTVIIITMPGVVLISIVRISFIPFKNFEKYAHALADATVFLSGVVLQFFGL
jgi:hypothetical protein